MKALSFSIFGTEQRYLDGLLRNIALRGNLYPDWVILVYCDKRNYDILSKMSLEHTFLKIIQPDSQGAQGTCWRFLAASEANVEAVQFRDADSVFTKREALAVNEWVNSPFIAHLMRDHPFHTSPIMAGMFGLKKEGILLLKEFMERNYDQDEARRFGYDQDFLNFFLYPKVKRKSLVHTNLIGYIFENIRPFKETGEGTFVGAYDHASSEEHKNYMEQREKFQPVTLLPFEWHSNRFLSWLQQRVKLRGIHHRP
jgi:hypothetical protein